MGQATMTTVDAILKEIYGPRIENQYTDELMALKRVERSSEGVVETVGGKYVDFPIKVSRNTGVGNRLEGEQIPDAGNQGYAEVHVPLRYFYGRGRVTGQLMQLAETNAQAFASGMDEEMDGLKDDMLHDANRQVYADGSGLLASITADGDNDNELKVDTVQYLEEGMKIDILVRSSGSSSGGATSRLITDIDEDGLVVTYDGADIDPDNTYGIYRAGNYLSGSQREVTGWGKIINNAGSLHGVDPSTQKKWKSVRKQGAGGGSARNSGTDRSLSEGLMIQTVDAIRTKGGGRPSVIFGGLGVRRAYFNLLTQQRRYTDTKEYAGGFTGLAFNCGKEIPVVEDVDMPPNCMYFIDEKKMKVYRNKQLHFVDDDGNILKWVTDYDAFQFVMRQYWEIGTVQRNAHGVLEDIIEG
jgi:hypothetical protein